SNTRSLISDPKLNQNIKDESIFLCRSIVKKLIIFKFVFQNHPMKHKIALLCGGYSGEAEVSFNSAAFVEKNINEDLYEVYKIKVMTDRWLYESPDGEAYDIDRNNFSLTLADRKINFDLVFMMIHGAPGENGLLQGYFEMLNIPYTCCDSLTSSLTMNKGYTKEIGRAHV